MSRIAVTTTSFGVDDPEPLGMLERAGHEVVRNTLGRALEVDETRELCAGCAGIVAGTERYDSLTLAALAQDGLRVISRVGVGMDAIDLDAAEACRVAVRNTPYGPTRSVAELTVALILDILRGVSRMDRELRSGTWKKRTGRLVLGKRVGVVGLGRIGRSVADLLAGLGAEVAYADVNAIADAPYGRMELAHLLEWADIVTLHSAATGDAALIGAAEIARMREGAYLINTSRGSLVDETALLAALEAGRLGGAALDVFGAEPYSGPLAARDDVVLTPHVGSYALEGRIQMEVDAVANLLEELSRP